MTFVLKLLWHSRFIHIVTKLYLTFPVGGKVRTRSMSTADLRATSDMRYIKP